MRMIGMILLLIFCIDCKVPENDYKQYFIEKIINKIKQQERVDQLLQTLRQKESSNRYHISGCSGEYGAYQFTKATWENLGIKYYGKVLDLKSKTDQDKIARSTIEDYVERGYSNEEIASLWNCGSKYYEGKIGINKYGVYYNTPKYVKSFIAMFNKIKLS